MCFKVIKWLISLNSLASTLKCSRDLIWHITQSMPISVLPRSACFRDTTFFETLGKQTRRKSALQNQNHLGSVFSVTHAATMAHQTSSMGPLYHVQWKSMVTVKSIFFTIIIYSISYLILGNVSMDISFVNLRNIWKCINWNHIQYHYVKFTD